MDNMEKLLGELHLAVGKDFLEKIKDGVADASVLREATKFLRDNDIKYDKDLSNENMEKLADAVIEIDGLDSEIVNSFKKVL